MYVIGNIASLPQEKIDEIKKLVFWDIPEDYLEFMAKYGFGTISGLILVEIPDEDFIRNNFLSYMDLWEWENEVREKEAVDSLYVFSTIDGDCICCIDNAETPYLILPRSSDIPVYLSSLEEVFSHYYRMYKIDEPYFKSNKDNIHETLYFHSDGRPDPEMKDKFRQDFLSNYSPDKSFEPDPIAINTTLYVLQGIGGTIVFNDASIRVTYQQPYEEEAKQLITSFNRQLP